MLDSYKLIFYPDDSIKESVKDCRDIYQQRYLLRMIKYTNTSFEYLVDIILDATRSGRKFRVLENLTVLRRILYARNTIVVEKNIIDKLFMLFQHYVFSSRREVTDQANNLIRNQILENEHVSWLLAHYNESPHILNRLLRYPERNEQITTWAKDIYEQRELPGREAEIIALLITDTLPGIYKDEDIATILWAIYYSRNSVETKSALLLEVINKDNVETYIEDVFKITSRIHACGLMEELLKRYG